MSVNAQREPLEEVVTEESDDLRQQFVTFFVGDQCMAFDMSRVMEIVRVPTTVDVPLTPSSLLGLANLRGTILPILSLRRVLGLEDTETNDATRVMVLNYQGSPMGFVVDKVTRVIGVMPEMIESSNRGNGSVDGEVLSGVIKNVDNQELIQLVDIDALTSQEYKSFTETMKAGASVGSKSSSTLVHQDEDDSDEDSDVRQLVSFSVADQEYSFDIGATQEIIRIPKKINEVPKAPPHVLGMVNLRGRILPLVKLRTMFGLPESELTEINRIVVLTLRRSTGTVMVGVVVDEVREVLRIRDGQVEEVPGLLLDNDDTQEFDGICQLDKGARIVTLLSADKMFDRQDIIEAVSTVAEQEETLNTEDLERIGGEDLTEESDEMLDEEAAAANETQLVVFNLHDQEYGVTIESVKEILRLPEDMTEVPKTYDFVEGMINLRGSVLPIINMRARFGLEKQDKNDRQRIVVLHREGVLTGYIVDSVSEVMRLQTRQIEDAPALSKEQAQMMGKIVNLRDSKRIITVLEPQRLLSNNEQRQLVSDVDENPHS